MTARDAIRRAALPAALWFVPLMGLIVGALAL